ncbi:MAG: hypothetical protein H6625_05955 [Bdellovibrionaceae bacterium]|nr:hypothetical protein [Pseudobdellovibrionaceae bacterium]
MNKLDEYMSSERSFLHGISTPLMVAMSQMDFILVKKEDMSPEEMLEKINKAKLALQKVSSAVHERRSLLRGQVDE